MTLSYEAMDFNSLSLTVDDEVKPLYLAQKCVWKKPVLSYRGPWGVRKSQIIFFYLA